MEREIDELAFGGDLLMKYLLPDTFLPLIILSSWV